MKSPLNSVICIIILLFSACNGKTGKQDNNNPESTAMEVASTPVEVTPTPAAVTTNTQLFGIESGYIKFLNSAAGQEMTREWRFDQYGARQAEDNYMLIMGQKVGDRTIVTDGYRYSWGYDSSEGRKSRFYQTVTDYEKVSEKDIERYGIARHGYEEILGKKCLKVTIERPAKSTIWVWNGIVLKTEALFSGNSVVMEAVEINQGAVENTFFELPAGVEFPEVN
jgi:hypothetical protein